MEENKTVIVIDVGNTRIAIAGYKNDELSFIDRIETNNVDEKIVSAHIGSILWKNNILAKDIEGSIISSVVPRITKGIQDQMEEIVGKEVFVVGKNAMAFIEILRPHPEKVGADLIGTALAAKEMYKLPAIVFALGTATTATVVNEKGQFIGGMIAPGVKISLDALSEKAALLPQVELEAPRKCINGETIECMQSGIIFGTASMIDGMIDRMEEELGKSATVILTGGTASKIKDYIKHKVIYNENLLLDGLYIMYRKNRKKEKII